MNDLSNISGDKLAALGNWASEIQSKKVDSQQTVPVDGQPVVPNPPDEPIKPVAVEVTSEQKPETEKVVEPEVPEIKSWDADDTNKTPDPTPAAPTFDFKKLGSALGWNELKDETELITKVTETINRNKELEQSPLNSVPDDLREIVEISKKSGQAWKQLLETQLADYNSIDPEILYEETFLKEAQNNPRYKNPDGTFNADAAENDLAEIKPAMKYSWGQQLKTNLLANQQARKAQIYAAVQEKLQAADKNLSTAAQSLSNLLPLDEFGIKFEPKHSVEIYSGITDASLIKKHLGDVSYAKLVEIGVDMNKLVKTLASADYLPKMIKYKTQTAEAKAKKAILDKTQNVKIEQPGATANPVDPKSIMKAPHELLQEHYAKRSKSALG
jgi:hypothetical protein